MLLRFITLKTISYNRNVHETHFKYTLTTLWLAINFSKNYFIYFYQITLKEKR